MSGAGGGRGRTTKLARVRAEAGISAAACAARCGLSERSYRRLEDGTLADLCNRDTFGYLLLVAPLLAERLGRPISAQRDLCGPAAPTARRDHARGRTDPTGNRGLGGSVRRGAPPRRVH